MVTIIKHPLIETKMSILREKSTKPKDFRQILEEIAELMAYEVFKGLEYVEDGQVETPMKEKAPRYVLKRNIILVPILRAGIGMVEGVQRIVPNAHIGVIGLTRDEKTLEPMEYYFKVPNDLEAECVLIDPMLATGGSAKFAIEALKKRGYKHIKLMCLVGCDQGIQAIETSHPEVEIYLSAKDPVLNEKGYILPGLGDAGDRIFGTNAND